MRGRVGIATTVVIAMSGSAVLAVAGDPYSASGDPPTGGTSIVGETFTGASVADPGWSVQGDACLTGAAGGSTPPPGSATIPSCSGHRAGGAILPGLGVTPGYLQLTDVSGNARGSILYNRPVPASAGVSITFDQFQYGGNGADGIGFFLVDGSTSLTVPGGYGGSLGYAQRSSEPGIAGGYLGVGLDAYGNFWDDGEGRGLGCPAGQRSPTTSTGPIAPNVISLRGPGSGLNGYCLLGATVRQPITNPTKPATTLNGGAGTLRADTLRASARTVNIQVTPVSPGNPVPRVIVQVRYTSSGPWIEELNIPAPPNTPSTYKFGLVASTGGNNDVHLIRAAQIQSILPLPQLQLEKQVDRTIGNLPPVIVPGMAIPYQYTVTNAGTVAVDSLAITDDRIPSASIVCTATTLQPAPALGSTTTCSGSYTVTTEDSAAGSVENTATANAASAAGPVTSPPSSVMVPLTSAGTITKSVTTAPPYAVGQQVAYQYVVRNTGGSTLSTFSVSDDRIAAGGVTCPVGQLATGSQMTCAGSHAITASQLDTQGFLINTATVSAITPLGQTVTSPPSSASVAVATDVAVTKTVDMAQPVVGSNVTFTITATNNGPSVATGVVVTDEIPDFGPDTRLVYVSSRPAPGTGYSPATGTWAIPSLPVGTSLTLSMTATVHSTAAITNSAARTATDQIDTNPANDSASVTLNPVVPTADLAVTKSVIGDAVMPIGGRATFRVTVTNLGPFPSTGVAVQDRLPPSLTYDPAASSGDGGYDARTGLWIVGSLAVGQTASRDFVVTGAIVDTYTNLATLAGNPTPLDGNPSNNSASATLAVRTPQADLAIVKNVFPQTAVVGDLVTYQMEASNNGPETANGVSVDDLWPAGVTVTGVTVERGTIDAGAGRWDIGTLVPGESLSAVITATVDVSGTQVNTATIRAPLVSDPVEDNNSSSATVTSDQPTVDIGVTKSLTVLTGGPRTRVALGGELEFALVATNNPLTAPATATNVMLRDPLPANLTYVSSNGDGSYNPTTGEWNVGTLAPGASARLVIRAVAAVGGHATNTVGLASLTENDADPTNNSDNVDLDILRLADLSIVKTVAPNISRPGETVRYSISVTNNGPNDSLDTFTYDPLMPSAEIIAFAAPPGTTFDEETRLWSIGALVDGATVTMTVDVRVSRDGWFRNDVVVDDNLAFDPDTDNNLSSAELEIPAADIEVTKRIDRPQADVGDTVTFTVGATNLGPDPAGTVETMDLLPPGLTLVSATPSDGAYEAATGRWTLTDLQPVSARIPRSGPTETLTIVATVAAPGTLENTASSDRSSSTPYDPNLTNNSQSATVVATPTPADLSLSKTADATSPSVGDTFHYTLVVSNAGPGAADSVHVDDLLPVGVVPVAATSGCSIGGQAVTCDLGTIAAGVTATITISARVEAAGELVNIASAASATPDPLPQSNAATASVTVLTPSGGGSDEPPASDTLSFTGFESAQWLQLAAVLTASGALLLFVGRRRRTKRHRV